MDNSDEIYAVDRIDATGASAILDRLQGTDLVERGSVVVISVEAIKTRAGERWFRKRDDVWAYVERKLNEHLSFHDLSQRVSETDFLVAMTSEEGAAAQAIAMKILEEVLTHFVGAADKADVKIRCVNDISGHELGCTELDPLRIQTAAAAAPSAIRNEADPDEERRRNPVSFVIASGQELRIDFTLEPVISLRHQVTAAMRIRPSVTMASTGRLVPARTFNRLQDDDVGFIDRATFDYGALFLAAPTSSKPALIMPASFRTLSSRKGRAALGTVRGASLDQVKRGAIIELADVDRGTPAGRLTEVAGLVGQLARGVLVRLAPARDALAPVRGTRMQGLTVDLAELELKQDQLATVLRAMALQMRGASPSLMALGLPDKSCQNLAWEAGFTHAGVKGIVDPNIARSAAA